MMRWKIDYNGLDKEYRYTDVGPWQFRVYEGDTWIPPSVEIWVFGFARVDRVGLGRVEDAERVALEWVEKFVGRTNEAIKEARTQGAAL